MKRTACFLAVVWMSALRGLAETSPPDTPLPADQVTRIACEWAGEEPEKKTEKPKSALKRPNQLKPKTNPAADDWGRPENLGRGSRSQSGFWQQTALRPLHAESGLHGPRGLVKFPSVIFREV